MTNLEGDIKLAATLVGFSLNSHGFQRFFPFFWLAIVITLVLVLQHSIEKYSNH